VNMFTHRFSLKNTTHKNIQNDINLTTPDALSYLRGSGKKSEEDTHFIINKHILKSI